MKYLYGNDKIIRKIIALRILPGKRIKVVRVFPAHLIQIDNTQIAIDKRMAESFCNENMRGRHSEIELRDEVVVKRFHSQFRYNFWKELAFLNLLQPFSFVPRLHGFNKNRLEIEMEYIKGVHIEDAIMDLSPEQLEKILDACRILDRLSIQKEEMNHPDRHIIVGDRIVFVDFERGVIRDKPSNLTQFLTYLNHKRRIIPKDEFISIMKSYKSGFSEKEYQFIKNRVLKEID